MRVLLLSFCMCLANILLAQTGQVQVYDHAGANDLVEKHRYFNREHSEIPGWRIQVFSNPSMSEANNQKALALKAAPDLRVHIIFEAPNYKVRLGNYRNRFDAYRDLQHILPYYPDAFICKDLINITE